MRKLLVALLVVVVLVVGALLALPLLISTDTVKAELIARIEEATGRQVRIDGPVAVSILPSTRLSAEGIGMSGLTGDSEAFAVESVSFGLNPLPLISGNVDITGITLVKPQILVEVDDEGRINWIHTAAAESEGAEESAESIETLIAGEGEPPTGEAVGAFAALERLSLGKVRIVDGTVTYRDRSSTEETLSALDLELDMPRIAGAGSLDGSFTWHGVEHDIDLTIGERDAAAPLERIPLELTLASSGGEVTASGTALDGDTLFAGSVNAGGDSLHSFAGGLGVALPQAPAFATFAASADLAVDGARVAVERFSGDLAGMAFNGAAQVAYDRARPGIGLRLAIGRVDTAMFTAPTAEDGDGDSSGGNDTSAGDGAIDLAPLRLVDVNAAIAAEAIDVGDVALTDLGVDLQLGGGVLSAKVSALKVDGAPGSGSLTVDAAGDVPAISGAIDMSGLDLAGLMALAGQAAPVSGTAGLDVAFETRGATTRAMIAALEARGSVTLADGRVTGLDLADMVGGDASADTIEGIDLTARFDSLSSPVAAEGGLTWRGERFTVAAEVDPRALAAAEGSDVTLNATSARVNVGFSGRANMSGAGGGKVSLSTPSLRGLLAWIGQPMEAGGGLEKFSVEGTIALTEDTFSFERASFTLDTSSGLGTGKVVFAGKPTVIAGLAMKVLDVTPYLLASGASGGKGSGGGQGSGGWSTAPIDFSGLKAIDANLNLKADKIVADRITIGPSVLTAKLTGGRLDANLSEMALYSGTGNGSVVFDGAAATPTMSASFKLDGVSAEPLLSDAIGFNRVAGTGSFNFAVKASGASEAALVKSLSGNGAMAVRDGYILGVDIPKMLVSLSAQTLLGWQAGNDRTEFAQLDATFTIADGIVTNDDLVLVGPLFSLTGAGRIDIPQQTVSYRINPQVAADGGKGELEDFVVPVRIDGSWSKPRIYPEIEGILENPEAALTQLRQLGGGLFGGGSGKKGKERDVSIESVATQAVQGLVGGAASTGDGGGQQTGIEDVAGQAIQGLIGGTAETAGDGGSGGGQQNLGLEGVAGQALQGLLGGDTGKDKKNKGKNKKKDK